VFHSRISTCTDAGKAIKRDFESLIPGNQIRWTSTRSNQGPAITEIDAPRRHPLIPRTSRPTSALSGRGEHREPQWFETRSSGPHATWRPRRLPSAS